MDVVGSITGFFRSILWAIIYLLLWVTDTIWQVVMKIGHYHHVRGIQGCKNHG